MASHLVTFFGAFSVNTINVMLVAQAPRNVRMEREERAHFIKFPNENVPPRADFSDTKARTRKRDAREVKFSTSCVDLSTPLSSLILKSRLPDMVGLSSC